MPGSGSPEGHDDHGMIKGQGQGQGGAGRDSSDRRGAVHIRKAAAPTAAPPEGESERERAKRRRAEAEGRRLASLNRKANLNREHTVHSPPIPTLQPGLLTSSGLPPSLGTPCRWT